jgi:alpha-D-ribose 1-methylphosphonate 5-triphosphate synthase subunit PhnI
MAVARRVSATFKDLPGGQILGPTFDYTHRLLDFALMAEGEAPLAAHPTPSPSPQGGGEAILSVASATLDTQAPPSPLEGEGWGGGATSAHIPHVMSFLNREGLIETDALGDATPPDLTREPMELPASRPLRLQALTRGDEGFILSLAYSTQRGYGRTHAFVGELRIGTVAVEMDIPELGFSIEIGEVELTECETVNQFTGSKTEPPQFTRGYGLVFGQTERKAIAMSLVDRALRWRELGEDFVGAPAQDEEFVLMHADNVQATGFLEHIKLPHYVDFQSELELIRRLRAEATGHKEAAE